MVTKERKLQRYKKVRHEGGSTVLTVGNLIPPDWQLVTIDKLKSTNKDKVILLISKAV